MQPAGLCILKNGFLNLIGNERVKICMKFFRR